jgi:hypothetical protein
MMHGNTNVKFVNKFNKLEATIVSAYQEFNCFQGVTNIPGDFNLQLLCSKFL